MPNGRVLLWRAGRLHAKAGESNNDKVMIHEIIGCLSLKDLKQDAARPNRLPFILPKTL